MAWVFEGTLLPTGRPAQVRVLRSPPAGSEPPSADEPDERLPGTHAMQGLVDGHCHLTLDRGEGWPFLDLDGVGPRVARLAQTGVSVVRDVGGDRTVTLRMAREPRGGEPLVLAAGRFLAPANRYFPGLFTPVGPDDLAAAVAAEVADGATWIKVVADFPTIDGGAVRAPVGPTFPTDAVAAVVRTAHALGARVAAHAMTGTASAMVRAGVDSIEHGDELTGDDLEELGARGGAWTPTLSSSFPGRRTVREEERDLARRMTSLLPVAVRAGVTVLAGSDITGTVPEEVGWLHRLGLTVEQALDAAGPSAAAYLGVFAADSLVTYAADPRVDLDLLAHPVAAVVRGVRVH